MQRTLGSKCKGKKITMTWKEIERGGQCAFQKTHHQKHNAHYEKFQSLYQPAKFWVYSVHQKQPIAQLKH
jgi:hypothetical protein